MQHEDRLIRSIDLLTANARETLNKFAVWANTSDSEVTFKLQDAIPSYNKSGSQGNAIFNVFSVPSFKTLSSGFFGSLGTTIKKDLYWNLNFISNGSGWLFDRYTKSNTNDPAQSNVAPKLEVRTDVLFSKSGYVNFQNRTITYEWRDSANNIDTTKTRLKLFNSYLSLNTGDIYVTSNYCSIRGKNTLSLTSDTSLGMKAPSISIYGRASNVNNSILLFREGATQDLDTITYGNLLTDSVFNAKHVNNRVSGDYLLSLDSDSGNCLLGYNRSANDIYIGTSNPTLNGVFNNVFVAIDAYKLASKTSEAIQFFIKNSATVDNTSIESYYDAWLDAGIDPSFATRTTAQYSDINNSISNKAFALNKTNPYYLNLGTKGVLSLVGGDTVSIKSGSGISLLINNSEEVTIKSGSVKIPNLELPKFSQFRLSTINKLSHSNPQILEASLATISANSNVNGVECTVGFGARYTPQFEENAYAWTTFNATSSRSVYYTYYLEDASNNTYDLYCLALDSTTGSPNPSQNKTPIKVRSNISKNIDPRKISVASGALNTYAFVVTEVPSFITNKLVTAIEIWRMGVNETSFTLMKRAVTPSFLKMDISITSEDIPSCGIQDMVWIVVESGVATMNAPISTTVVLYDGNKNTLLFETLPTTYSNVYVNTTPYTFTTLNRIPEDQHRRTSVGNSKVASAYNNTTFKYEAAIVLNVSKMNGWYSESGVNTYSNAVGGAYTTNIVLSAVYDQDTLSIGSNFKQLGNTAEVDGFTDTMSQSKTFAPNSLTLKIDSTHKLHGIFSDFDWRASGQLYAFLEVDATYADISNSLVTITASIMANISNAPAYSHYYRISQAKGFTYSSGVYGTSILTLAYTYNAGTNNPFTLYIYQSTNTSLAEAITLQSQNATNTFTADSGDMVALDDKAFVVVNAKKLTYKWSSVSNIDYSTLSSTIKTSDVSLSYVNELDVAIRSSYCDVLGFESEGHSDYGILLSNNKNKKQKYYIRTYALDSNVDNEALSITKSTTGDILNIVDITATSSELGVLQYVSLENSDIVTPNTVSIGLKVNDIKVNSVVESDILIFANNSNKEVSLTRNGHVNYIDAGMNNFVDRSLSYFYHVIPVELLSIFAKKAYRGDSTNVIRDDYSIIFTPTSAISGTADKVVAVLRKREHSNTGHNLESYRNLSTARVKNGVIDDTAYLDDYDVYLIYDVAYDRVIAYAPNEAGVSFEISDYVTMKTLGIVYSIKGSLLNTFSSEFDSYLSIINENSNVVSLRVDFVDGVKFGIVSPTSSLNHSTLFLGLTDINNQESGC